MSGDSAGAVMRGGFADPRSVAAACIVLNGPSCSGKSSIAAALQERWPRPLQSTGIDTFLASQSERFFAIDGTLIDGISWVPTTIDSMPAFDIVPGELGLGMIRASHSFWSSCVEAGLDQVIDDVWVIPEQPTGSERALSRATVLWVGVHCPFRSSCSASKIAATGPSALRGGTTG